uniref:TRAP transporter permease n=1 Tax=Pararhizobium sp. IMCC3301 TaxID=3067904 RepID=UPI00274149E6|nr:TRAP transporter fused permease subunit [Pararhizobium sp. IMCC3301]
MRAETHTRNDLPATPNRAGSKALQWAISGLAVALSVSHLWMNSFGNVSTLWQNGIHFGGFAVLCALVSPISAHSWARHGLVRALDIGFGLAVGLAALYLVYAEDGIYDRGVRLVTMDWIAGTVVILGAIEFTRRTTGWIIPILIVLSLSYISFWGAHISGIFAFRGLSTETLMFRSIYGDDALFGSIARISSTFVFMFIIFGAFLLKSGAGEFIIDISRVVAGRTVGGPGFVAVLASGLTGTISGSAVANTASTGVITIPLMKRAGFAPKFAAGVEAASSTGGQLMPPIMGAGAFVMAAATQIPYTHIVAMSALPALLYFATVAFFVRIDAKRTNADLISGDDTPALLDVLKRGAPSFIIPVALLITLLVRGYTPTYAAGYAILACIAASWLTPHRMGPKAIFAALELGARNMIMTAILLTAVGLIVNVIATAGIGNTFSIMISSWADGNLLVALVLVALASLVLGMGLPVTAAYIVLGTLSAPALYQLILQSQITDLLIAGQVPQTAKAVFMIAVPEQLAALSAPMSQQAAAEIMASLPLETLVLLYDLLFDPSILMAALLSAHMIVFWLSQDSNVTPPVCLAAFTAAAIAKSPPMQTGFSAWKIAKGLYLVPLLFAYTPLLAGDWATMLEITIFALFGLWAIGAAIEGHWENPLDPVMRLAILLVGATLLWPLPTVWHMVALAGFAGLFAAHLRMRRPAIA